MHQTFYIDVDEEVNSVISKLRKSSSKYNILVIAQRALILQSAVSLKLIKREVDLADKKIMIVTQDERGLSIARKVGFPTRKTIDNIKQEKKEKISIRASAKKEQKTIKKTVQEIEVETNKKISNEKNRLKNLGAKEYVSPKENQQPLTDNRNTEQSKEVDQQFFGERDINQDIPLDEDQFNSKADISRIKESEFNDLFVTRKSDKSEKKVSVITTSQRAGKFLQFFGIISFILFLGVVTYLFLPQAKIIIFPKKSQQYFSFNLEATSNQNNGKNGIIDDMIRVRAETMEVENTLSLSFDATGESKSTNQKARGRIIIYNEFSEASQILVATTRFLTEDGKLFRLTSSVTVPGEINGEAGKIEAEVIADQAGEEYNIEGTSFKIPGFKGSSKYDKFYAKSEQKMRGGGENTGQLKSVSESDIANAKEKVVAQLKERLKKEVKVKKRDGDIVLSEALKFEIVDSASFPGKGAVTDKFEYQARMKMTALIFSDEKVESSLRKYLENKLAKKNEGMQIVVMDKKYDQPVVNMEEKHLVSNIEITVELKAEVNLEEIKQELLGKNQKGIDELINKHQEVQKIEAFITPSFLGSRIPRYNFRVKTELVE